MENIIITEWLDALWILIFLFLLHKNQKLFAAGFVACNMIMMRMMAELMVWIGYPLGFFTVLDTDQITRGQLSYSAIYLLYLIVALYSPKSNGSLFMAMSISLFFAASIIFSIAMVL